MTTMNWQDLAVAVIAVVVIIALIVRIWRFFTCHETSKWSSCEKECKLRN